MPKLERARGGRSDRGRGEDRDEQTMASAEASQAAEAPRYDEVAEVVDIDEIPAAILADEA